MSWIELALAFLKLTNLLVGWAKDKQQMDAGADRAVAQASVAILNKTQSAKQVMAEVMAMTDSQVDEALKRLEP